MSFPPQVYVMRIGDLRWSRYVIADLDGQYWSHDGWTAILGDADVFQSEQDALAARNEFCTAGEERETFTATIVITVTKGEWTEDELRQYLRRRGKFHLQHASEMKAIAVEVVSDDMRKPNHLVETDDGPESDEAK